MLTRQTDYALRALLRLARLEPGKVISTATLAEEMEIPYRFLRRILLGLVDKGLVTSTRGKHGGLCLARPPAEINLRDIVQAVEPEALILNLCLTDAAVCCRQPHCVVHTELAKLQKQLADGFAEVTLAALVAHERERSGEISGEKE